MHSHILLLSILLLSGGIAQNGMAALGGNLASDYPHSLVLSPLDYTVYWRVDLPMNVLYLALRVKTTGWVGFGISEITSGSMPGADIVVGSVVNGVGSISDRWSSAYAEPDEDECQNWFLVASEEADGYTTLEIQRPINTTDAQDRTIVPGANMIIAAYGTRDTLSYHSTNRVSSMITFFGEMEYNDTQPGDLIKEIKMSNYSVPNRQTTYACQAFVMPTDQDYYITQIDPIIEQANIKHVHHFLVHVCDNSSLFGEVPLVQRYPTPGRCGSPLGDIGGGCTTLLSAWALGGGSTFTPPDAGFPMGPKNNSIKFLILEVHYDNPGAIGGYTDNSGVRIHYTTIPRKYDAGVIVLGDGSVSFPPIPANTAYKEYETECLSECTSSFTSSLTVFQSFPHMHQVGSEIWTTQWRDGKQIAEVGRVEFWSFDHQMSQILDFTIQPGDRFNTHCAYNTLGVSKNVTFGTASDQEMCLHFLSYYPRMLTPNNYPFSFCGYVDEYTICGDVMNVLDIPNPLNRDPPGGGVKNFGVARPCPEADSSDKSQLSLPVIIAISVVSIALLAAVVVFLVRRAFSKQLLQKKGHHFKLEDQAHYDDDETLLS